MKAAVTMVAIAAIALSAACGGGGGSAPTATAPPGMEPTATVGAAATSEPAPTPGSAFQSFAYEVRFAAVLDSPSTGVVTSIERRADGLFEAPSSHAFAGGLGIAGQTPPHQGVVIGDRAWYREGGGPWQEISTTEFLLLPAGALTSAQPGFLNDGAFENKLGGLDSTPEESGGVAAHKYDVPADEVSRISDLLSVAFLQDLSQLENVDVAVWTSEETGALVRVELSLTTTPAAVLGQVPEGVPADAVARVTLHLQLSRLNDPAIKISAPI